MKNIIEFHLESGVAHPFSQNENKISSWLQAVATAEDKQIKCLNYIFCSDDYLLDINIRYLGHDYYTDIITFPYEKGDILSGDLFISLDRVAENAREFKCTFDEELSRVMVHGLLHLIGYADKSEQEKKLMTQKENYYMDKYF